MQARFLVTGCARSGTGYTASLLTALGCACGHERVFCPDHLWAGDELVWPDDVAGESSWLAAPFLSSLPPDLPVLHQVREPIAFLRSKLRTQFFERPTRYKTLAERVLPEVARGSALERAMRYWIGWNRLVMDACRADGRPYLCYGLEAIDAHLLGRMLDLIGFEGERARVEAALAGHPRDYNTRGSRGADGAVTLQALPAGALLDEFLELAEELGYASAGASPTFIRKAG